MEFHPQVENRLSKRNPYNNHSNKANEFQSQDHSMPIRLHQPDDRSPCIYNRIQQCQKEQEIHVRILLGYRIASYFHLLIQHRTISHSCGITSKVYRNIEYTSFYNTYQLPLGIFLLEVEPTKDTFGRTGMIVLYKLHSKSGFFHILLMIGFYEITSGIAMNCGLDDT